jgi:hypothetical protein
VTPAAKPIVPMTPTCRHCGAAGQHFLRRCPKCGKRHWIPSSNIPGAKH